MIVLARARAATSTELTDNSFRIFCCSTQAGSRPAFSHMGVQLVAYNLAHVLIQFDTWSHLNIDD